MQYFIFCKERILLVAGKIPTQLNSAWLLTAPKSELEFHFGDETCFAIEVSEPLSLSESEDWVDLRATFDVLSLREHQAAGKARELLYWDDQTRFCSHCGTPLEAGILFSKRCPQCGKEHWTVITPAIIVAVHRNDEILLTRSHTMRGNYMGLVAGFVEPGESLEECVRREVREETNLEITNIRYFGSQPWPYPSVQMIGFHADYLSGEIEIQREELVKAGWYSRENLPEIPGKVSLARKLIDDWLSWEK